MNFRHIFNDWTGFFHAAHGYTSQQQMLWECPLAFLSFCMPSPSLLLLLSCPGPHCVFLCGISHSEALKEWTARSWESCTACRVFLGLHEVTTFQSPSLPAQVISSKTIISTRHTIHLNHGDGLEQDMLHYHEPKYLCVCLCIQSDALEQDILHYHESKCFYVSVCVQSDALEQDILHHHESKCVCVIFRNWLSLSLNFTFPWLLDPFSP